MNYRIIISVLLALFLITFFSYTMADSYCEKVCNRKDKLYDLQFVMLNIKKPNRKEIIMKRMNEPSLGCYFEIDLHGCGWKARRHYRKLARKIDKVEKKLKAVCSRAATGTSLTRLDKLVCIHYFNPDPKAFYEALKALMKTL